MEGRDRWISLGLVALRVVEALQPLQWSERGSASEDEQGAYEFERPCGMSGKVVEVGS